MVGGEEEGSGLGFLCFWEQTSVAIIRFVRGIMRAEVVGDPTIGPFEQD